MNNNSLYNQFNKDSLLKYWERIKSTYTISAKSLDKLSKYFMNTNKVNRSYLHFLNHIQSIKIKYHTSL